MFFVDTPGSSNSETVSEFSENAAYKQSLRSSIDSCILIETLNPPMSPLHLHEKESKFMDNHPICSKKERMAWYTYDWANGAYFYVASVFLPLVITSQALATAKVNFCGDCPKNEWAIDFENKGMCSDNSFLTNSTCLDSSNKWTAQLKHDAKFVSFLGSPIGYASVSQYVTVIAIFIQLLLFVTMGKFADYGPNRKRMFIWFNSTGVLALFFVYFMNDDSLYWLTSLLWIVSIACFGFSVVFYNAYIGLLAATHPDALKHKNVSSVEMAYFVKNIINSMSLKGLAFGFLGQLVFLILCMPLLILVSGDDNLNTRLVISISGVWVLIFSTWTFYQLKTRPGPPLPAGESYCHLSITGAIHTTKLLYNDLPELGKYLVAYFIFSDGASTVGGASIVFAQVELNLSSTAVLLVLVEVSLFAVAGCFFFKWIHEKFGVSSKNVLMINLVLMGIIPIYVYFVVYDQWTFYIAALVFGFNTGSQQAFTRSVFVHGLPLGREAEFFAFYEISDKGTAWLGPLAVGLVFQATGSYRNAYLMVTIFFVTGIFLLWRFQPDKAEIEKNLFEERTKDEI